MTDHPITPPPELVGQWLQKATGPDYEQRIATQAARWGSDQELEACCEWAAEQDRDFDLELRAARRPAPPNPVEKALTLINKIQGNQKPWQLNELDVVRTALERLQELENND